MEPPLIPPQSPENRDSKHLHLLAVFHFVVAGLSLLSIAFLILYMIVLGQAPEFIGSAFKHSKSAPSDTELEQIGVLLKLGTWFLAILLAFTIAEGILNVIAGFDMLKRRRRTLSMVAAALNCLSVPFGTTLGVFTFIVLTRDSVRQLYAKTQPNPIRRKLTIPT